MHRPAWLLIGVLTPLRGGSYLFIKVALDEHLGAERRRPWRGRPVAEPA